MKVTDIVARIAAQCPGFAHVAHALTSGGDYDYPAAFVAPVKRVAEFPRMLGYHAQMTRQTFGVYVVLPKRQDTLISSAADDLDDLCAELRAALTDWMPAGADQPLFYVGGELAEREGIACWREDFATDIDMRY